MRTIDNLILESIYYKKVLIKENYIDDITKLLSTIDTQIITNIHNKYKKIIPDLNIIDLCKNAVWNSEDLINFTGIINDNYQIKIDVIPTKNLTKGLFFESNPSNDQNYYDLELCYNGDPLTLLKEIVITTNDEQSIIESITPIIAEEYLTYTNGPESTFLPKKVKKSQLVGTIFGGVRLK